jgi:glycosyltransferase involved in cell wall biosynthesis
VTECRTPPLVSVIIPVHDGERFVAEAIGSVIAQTYRPLEIIAVDDGSTDGSAAIVRAFPGVRYLHQPNRGVGAARNRGVAAATGEAVAFLDQDDLWLPDKIARQMRRLADDPSADYALVRQSRFLDASATAVPAWINPALLNTELEGREPSALLVSRATFDRVGAFDESYRHNSDSDWFFRASEAGLRAGVVPAVLLLRRVHGANSSAATALSQREIRRVALASIRRRREGARS